MQSNLSERLKSLTTKIRTGLIAIGVIGALVATGCNALGDSTKYSLPPEFIRISVSSTFQNMDCSKLETLTNEDEPVTAEERFSALEQNVSALIYLTNMGNLDQNQGSIDIVHTGSSALMTNEGGYFVSAGHSIRYFLENLETDNRLLAVYHFKSNQLYIVREIMVDPERDIAFFNAPTGKPYKPVKGIEFRNTALNKGEELHMFPVKIEAEEYPFRYDTSNYLNGTIVGTHVREDRIPDQPEIVNLIKVEGMLSFPGTSGSPVSDDLGKLVGVGSIIYREQGKGVVGTLVASLQHLNYFTYRCDVQTLELPKNLQK